MIRLVVFFTSFVFLLVFGVGDADARRFGGGGSKGTFSSQATPASNQASKQQAANPAKSASGRGFSGIGSMFMGLAAGGLLAALFMGGVFDGIQFLDILLIALIAGGLIYFLRSRRKQQHIQYEQPAMSSFVRNNYSDIQAPSSNQSFNTDTTVTDSLAKVKVDAVMNDEEVIYGAPDWFNEKTFLEGARSHFLDLQKAWDANDLSTIESYVTPQLYKFLKEERAAQVNHVETQVHKLAVEMTNIQQLPSKLVELAIMFHGVINEGEEDLNFCEIWHLIRDMNQENALWLIQGIEQVES
ncbi:MAG TPA: TIM44-like domain-containing protein [Marinospirillum sp.]|uniref:Tim44 domain-containing protein n=1 Tax=Marinospirillum sp. TaxID=2183934 RepID=UPI002B47E9DF|nr:TIM44-like domain-containing protein [Marinospirillum sp.]HKM15242.1 TIM44-like domain-containing protein [Marinospirillum sp.]